MILVLPSAECSYASISGVVMAPENLLGPRATSNFDTSVPMISPASAADTTRRTGGGNGLPPAFDKM